MPTNIVVPEVGESIVDARVAKWLVKQGDTVSAGDPLVELETDKIDLEVSAPQSGVVERIDHQEGADVKVGDVLGAIGDAGSAGADAGSAGTDAGGAGTDAGGAGADGGGAGADAGSAGGAEKAQGKTRATPTARKAAEQHAVDLTSVKGSGDAGRVMRRDVEQAAAPGKAEPQPAAAKAPAPAAKEPAPVLQRRAPGERTEERIRMSKRRATIARRLVEVQSTAAMLTTFNEMDMSAMQALRARHKESFKERQGVSLGMTSFFVKAVIGALRAYPRINAEIQGDEMVLKHYYDIGIAVGASEGLVVPVLRDADRMGFAGIELAVRDFAARAGDGTLTLEDLKGGTFTITNGGVFGSLMSTPILNPPQVGILGLHKIADRPVAVNGQVVVRPMMYLALSYDHRIVDGKGAVTFLVRVKEALEDPRRLLMDL
jgi:2-oxoglutarate dehydrogenase E2 component (dihydrolipoamide succinyltransferase)